MPDVFEFTIAKPSLQLGADRTGSVAVDVTSRLGRHGVVGVEVRPVEGADAAWFAAPEPAEFDLPDGETLRTTVPIAVPADAAAGEYQFSVRAYAIDNPQQDFTNSPTISMAVPPPMVDGGIPKWIFIVIAVLVALILGLVIWFVFLRSDKEVGAPDLIAKTIPEALSVADDDLTVRAFVETGVAEADACVVLQTPPAGTPTATVSVLGVECPVQAPSVATPEALADLCNPASESFKFCLDITTSFGEDFATDPAWIEASSAMVIAFVEAFQIDGDPVPTVIGMTTTAATAVIDDAGFVASVVDDGSAEPRCVLFQHPYGEENAVSSEVVALVETRCPASAQTAAEVVISPPLDTVTFSNVCVVVAAFCDAVDAGVRGPGFTATPEFGEDLAGMVLQFRNVFTGAVVPDVVGLRLSAAQQQLDDKGLSARFVEPPQPAESDSTSQVVIDPRFDFTLTTVFNCLRVSAQSPPDGTLISLLDVNDVVLDLEWDLCRHGLVDQVVNVDELVVRLGD